MDAWKLALIAQIVDQADSYLAGRSTASKLLANTWGLMEAADLRMTPTWEAFYLRWARIDGEHELLTESWAPDGSGSTVRLASAVEQLRAWAAGETT
jgi:hypothetical protein